MNTQTNMAIYIVGISIDLKTSTTYNSVYDIDMNENEWMKGKSTCKANFTRGDFFLYKKKEFYP